MNSPLKRLNNPHSLIYTRLRFVLLSVLIIVIIGTLGYWIMGRVTKEANWSLFDCLYMTIITLTTVGYEETLDLSLNPWAKPFTLVLLVLGSGAVLTCFGMATAYLVEGSLGEFFWRHRMQDKIDKLNDHFIVAGAGSTGVHVIEELRRTQTPFVIIELDPERIKELMMVRDTLVCQGNAEEDYTLLLAGIQRAKGFVSTLPEDRDNAFVTLTARSLNRDMRIVAKATSLDATIKMKRAGADTVVSPNAIGGMRMASEILRPHVVSFLDAMLRDDSSVFRIEQVKIPHNSPIIGMPLKKTNFYEKTGLLIVAICKDDGTYTYNPHGDMSLEGNEALIVVGDYDQLRAASDLVNP